MRLPKLYSPVKIRFWSLRNGIGSNGGVIFDCDEKVERTVRRVITPNGWKWQIINLNDIAIWDWNVITDQECLSNGDPMDVEFV